MAGRPNVSTGALPSTYGVGAWGAQGSSKNYKRPLGREAGRVLNSAHFNHPTGRTTGGNSYSGGFRPGHGDLPGARAVRSAGYGQGKLHPAPMGVWQPRAPFHTGTPANLQRPAFDNWSAKKASCQGEMGHKSAIVYWGDLRARDEKMRAMRLKYPLNQERRALIQDAFSKLDRDGDGLVTLQDLRDNGYNAKSHPRYLAAAPNHWTEEQVFMNVIARFKMGEYEPGTTHKFSSITYDEFEEYYRVVGEELDDEYFGAMMAQAWRLQRRAPGMQGWDAQVLSHLALVEANMMGDGYLGKEALDKSKLSAITVSSDDAGQMATWKSMVESGEYSQMMRAAEALDKYVGQEESFDDFPNPLPAPAVRLSWLILLYVDLCPHLCHLYPCVCVCVCEQVRLWRLGGGALMTKLATAQDPLIKRVCASVLFQALRDHLARLELSADAAGKTLLLRQGLPALVQSTDVVTRNKAERVKALLL